MIACKMMCKSPRECPGCAPQTVIQSPFSNGGSPTPEQQADARFAYFPAAATADGTVVTTQAETITAATALGQVAAGGGESTLCVRQRVCVSACVCVERECVCERKCVFVCDRESVRELGVFVLCLGRIKFILWVCSWMGAFLGVCVCIYGSAHLLVSVGCVL